MANVKINQLPLATTPLTGTEVFPLVQGTTTKQVSITGLFTSPVMTNPTLGTVGQADLINATGLPISTGVAGLGSGIATFLGTPSSANLRAAVTDETGTGALVFATSPTLVTPDLGTPTAMVATNITGTALGLIAGSTVTNANLTGAVTSVGNATSLGSFTSAQLRTALTDETGSGVAVFATSPTLVTPDLGTPSAGVLTNATGLPLTTGVTGTLGLGNGGTGQTTANAAFNALAPSQTGNSGKYLTTDGTNTSWATNPLGTVTSVDVSGGTTGLTTSGGPVTTSGTITIGGTLATTNGGTGLTSFTANGVLYASSTSALTSGSALTFDGTKLGVGGTPPYASDIFAAKATTDGDVSYTFRNASTGTSARSIINIESFKVGSKAALQFGDTSYYTGYISADSTNGMVFALGNSATFLNSTEQMRLTSSLLSVVPGATIQGLTVGRGAGAVSTNTAVGASALAANTSGNYNTAVGNGAGQGITTGGNNTFVGYRASYVTLTGNYNVGLGNYTLYNTTSGSYNTALGYDSMETNSTGSYNVAVGQEALFGNTTASNNTAVGYRAAYSNTTGEYSTSVGYQAGYANTTGEITAIGALALKANTTGSNNSAVGDLALYSNTTGSYNTAMGRDALRLNTTASNNTAVGYQAGYSNTTGIAQVLVGYQAGYAITTASSLTAVGYAAASSVTTGEENTAIGSRALNSTTTGAYNVAVGRTALYSNTTGYDNTAVGYAAGYSTTTGYYNTFVGDYSGYSHTTGVWNTCIGKNSGYSLTTGSKNTLIGGYNGNQGGLDISTSSNYIVLSDGDGNPKLQINNSTGGNMLWLGERLENSSSNNMVINNAASIRINIDCDNNNPDGESFAIGKNQRSIDNNNKLFEVTEAGLVDLPYGQIKFPATQNASSNANTLDDYEEGTWTFAVNTTTGSVTMTSGLDDCYYIKIGRLVTVGGQVTVNSVSSPTGAIVVSLPFAGPDLTETAEYPSGSIYIGNSVSKNANDFALLKQDGFEMRIYIADVSLLSSANPNAEQLQAGTVISFQLSYYASP